MVDSNIGQYTENN